MLLSHRMLNNRVLRPSKKVIFSPLPLTVNFLAQS
jgi:hypothetical protein